MKYFISPIGFDSLINSLLLKDKNIQINVDNKRVSLKIEHNSDLSTLYFLIKNLTNSIRFIPESIYIIKDDYIKIKKSLNRFRNIGFWEFLDLKEELSDGLVFKSEDFEWYSVTGWEIRFKLDLSQEDLDLITNEAVREGGLFIENLKKNDK